MDFYTGDYHAYVLDKNNIEQLKEVQKLRYDYLLREFNPSLPVDGIDDDGFDEFCDSLLVVDTRNNKIIGTYRVSTLKTSKGHYFKSETEFNIDDLKNSGYGILETGRAVVHANYRNGAVIGALWKALFLYASENDCRYIFGTCSFMVTDPKKYAKLFAYMKDKYMNKDYNIFATKDSFEIEDLEYDEKEIEIPSLLKGYIRLGTSISRNGFIDYEFNCCDLVTIMDCQNMNPRYLKHFLG